MENPKDKKRLHQELRNHGYNPPPYDDSAFDGILSNVISNDGSLGSTFDSGSSVDARPDITPAVDTGSVDGGGGDTGGGGATGEF
jgi:hypothetical protein